MKITFIVLMMWLGLITWGLVQYYHLQESRLERSTVNGVIVDTFHVNRGSNGFATGLLLGGPAMGMALSGSDGNACGVQVSIGDTLVGYVGQSVCLLRKGSILPITKLVEIGLADNKVVKTIYLYPREMIPRDSISR